MMMVNALGRRLPERYIAEPQVHLGPSIEIDVATFEGDEPDGLHGEGRAARDGGGVATAVWAAPSPTLTVATGPPDQDEYEVRVYDTRRGRRLVAAVEIVSPSNKDRPDHRRAFVTKCATLLRNRVCVVIVDIVTTRGSNLYADLMEHLGQVDPSLGTGPPSLSAVACRWSRKTSGWTLETWAYPLDLGRPLPILPLWLEEAVAIPLDLEESYEETCRVLRIE